MARRSGVPLEAYCVGTGEDVGLVSEPGSDWAALHVRGPTARVLVRPDGFAAWRVRRACARPQARPAEVLERIPRGA